MSIVVCHPPTIDNFDLNAKLFLKERVMGKGEIMVGTLVGVGLCMFADVLSALNMKRLDNLAAPIFLFGFAAVVLYVSSPFKKQEIRRMK